MQAIRLRGQSGGRLGAEIVAAPECPKGPEDAVCGLLRASCVFRGQKGQKSAIDFLFFGFPVFTIPNIVSKNLPLLPPNIVSLYAIVSYGVQVGGKNCPLTAPELPLNCPLFSGYVSARVCVGETIA